MPEIRLLRKYSVSVKNNMKILDDYISRSVLTNSFIVLLALVGIFTFFAFIGDLSEFQGTNAKMSDLVFTAILGVPALAYQLMPLAVLIGSLLTLGGMMEANELVIIRVAGAAKIQILWVVMKTSVLLAFTALLLGEYIAPLAQGKIDALSLGPESRVGVVTNKIWMQDSNTFVSINGLLSDCKIVGVKILRLGDDGKLNESIYAEQASCAPEGWILKEVKRTRFKGDAYDTSHTESLVWKTELDYGLLGLLGLEPRKLTLKELYLYLHFADENLGDIQRWSQAFWTRVVYPLGIMLMGFLSLTIALTTSRGASVSASIFMGCAIGIIFYLLNELTGNFGLVFNISPALTAILPSFLVFFFAAWLFRRVP